MMYESCMHASCIMYASCMMHASCIHDAYMHICMQCTPHNTKGSKPLPFTLI